MSESETETLPTQIYSRPKWKHVTRWMAFLLIMLMDLLVVAVAVNHSLQGTEPFTWLGVAKRALGFALLILLNASVLPSIVLEANKVELTKDSLILYNLLYRAVIPWEDVKSIKAPLLLKFAIIKTPKFFQLINKRDMERYQDAIDSIRVRAGLPSD